MDRRFEKAWQEMEARRARGEPLDVILRGASDAQLVGALAGVDKARDGVAANAIATQLLNRLHRKPFLGSFLMGATTFALIYALDYAYTGTFLLLDAGRRANLLAVFSIVVALISLASWHMWNGRLPRLRLTLRSLRDRG